MSGRQIKVRAEGDSAEELEQAALEQARGFFPDGTKMGIIPGYVAATMSPLMGTPPAHAYWAEITVGEAFSG